MTKHKPLIEDLEIKQLITEKSVLVGREQLPFTNHMSKGIEFCKTILESIQR